MDIDSVSDLRVAVRTAEDVFERIHRVQPGRLYLGRDEYRFAVDDPVCFDRRGEDDIYRGMTVIQVCKKNYLAVA